MMAAVSGIDRIRASSQFAYSFTRHCGLHLWDVN
jgi:hypothetical protein